jgi:folate-binding protein YgfZ
VIQIKGERARELLQGQLTCDLREVTDHQMRQGALCNLKGRILALLDVIREDEQHFQLVLPDDLCLDTKKSLEKTALLSRVSLHQTNHYQCLGFHLQNSSDELPFNLPLPSKKHDISYGKDGCCYHLGNNFFIILIATKAFESITQPFVSKGQWRGSLAWHNLQLQEKRIDIYPVSRGLFLPHRLDLHLSDYLSFNKGCYKGQEIIARTHYRAKLKHTLKIFYIDTKEPLQSGQKLYDNETNVEIGELIDYCPLENHGFLIAASVLFNHSTTVHFEGHNNTVLYLETFKHQ